MCLVGGMIGGEKVVVGRQLGISAMGGCRCGVAVMEVSGVKGEGFFNIYRERLKMVSAF